MCSVGFDAIRHTYYISGLGQGQCLVSLAGCLTSREMEHDLFGHHFELSMAISSHHSTMRNLGYLNIVVK
jgi:hypothetical protein